MWVFKNRSVPVLSMFTKSLTLALDVPEPVSEVLSMYGHETSRWERRAMGYLYHQWTMGKGVAGVENGPLAPYLQWKVRSKYVGGNKVLYRKLFVDKRNLYGLLLTTKPRASRKRPDGSMRSKRMTPTEVGVPKGIAGPSLLQACLADLGTSFESLLDQELQASRRKERHITNRCRRNVAWAKTLSQKLHLPLDPGVGVTNPIKRAKLSRHPRISKRFRKETMMAPQGLPAFPTEYARFIHTMVEWMVEGDAVTGFSVPHPLDRSAGRLHFVFPPSDDPDYHRKLHLIAEELWKDKYGQIRTDGGQKRLGVDLFQREGHGGKMQWYARITVTFEGKEPIMSPRNTLGVHIGEAETATTAFVDATGVHGSSVMRKGKALRHRMDLLASHRRKLQKGRDNKGWDVTAVADRIRGLESRLRKEQAHVVSRSIIAEAERKGAQSISMENLSARFPRLEEKNRGAGTPATVRDRQWNRRVFHWNRGQFQEDLAYKAEWAGLRLAGGTAGVSPVMDSHTCPRCGKVDPEGRDFKNHRFRCVTCGEIDDEVGAAMVVAQRGYRYFTSPKGKKPKGPDDPSPNTHRAGGGYSRATSPEVGAYPMSQRPTEGGTVTPSGHSLDWTENHGDKPEGVAQASPDEGSYVGSLVTSVADDNVTETEDGKHSHGQHSDTGNVGTIGVGVGERTGGEMSSQTRSHRREIASEPTTTPRTTMPEEDPLENGSPLTPKDEGSRRDACA